jgi:hypothetical protein
MIADWGPGDQDGNHSLEQHGTAAPADANVHQRSALSTQRRNPEGAARGGQRRRAVHGVAGVHSITVQRGVDGAEGGSGPGQLDLIRLFLPGEVAHQPFIGRTPGVPGPEARRRVLGEDVDQSGVGGDEIRVVGQQPTAPPRSWRSRPGKPVKVALGHLGERGQYVVLPFDK